MALFAAAYVKIYKVKRHFSCLFKGPGASIPMHLLLYDEVKLR